MERWGVVLGVLLVACSDGGRAAVRFADLEDGAVIGGPQRTVLQTDIDAGAVRADLFLDGERVGSAEAAPFAITWDTTVFREGAAELRARVEGADDTVEEAALQVVLDNTPPEVQPVESPRVGGDVIALSIVDQNRIVAVELVIGGDRTTWSGLPAVKVWPDGCAESEVTVTATDEAGWSSTATSVVTSYGAGDFDCDGYVSSDASPAGPDCDDADPAIRPGQEDLGPGGDLNCDGVAGTDADRDGIAAVGLGGRDCDDTDPSIHPSGTVYVRHAFELAGGPLVDGSGSAAAIHPVNPDRDLGLVINNGGEVWFAEVSSADVTATSRLLVEGTNLWWTDAVDDGDTIVFYGKGRDLRAQVRSGDAWTDQLVLTADEPIGRIAAAFTASGETSAVVAARSGEALHLARRVEGGWEESLVDAYAGWPEGELSVITADGSVDVTYLTNLGIRRALIDPQGTVQLTDLGSPPALDYNVKVCAFPLREGAYYAGEGCLWRTDESAPVECPGPIEQLFCGRYEVGFQVRDGALGVRHLNGSREYRAVKARMLARRADYGYFGAAFDYDSIYMPERFISAADDPVDGVDRDCNGLD